MSIYETLGQSTVPAKSLPAAELMNLVRSHTNEHQRAEVAPNLPGACAACGDPFGAQGSPVAPFLASVFMHSPGERPYLCSLCWLTAEQQYTHRVAAQVINGSTRADLCTNLLNQLLP
jgi:hypothetical protein